jgi:hypothetical protein
VRSIAVVMINEHGDRALEMTHVHDQQPVQTFGPDGPNEPFRQCIGLGYLNRRANDSGADDEARADRDSVLWVLRSRLVQRLPASPSLALTPPHPTRPPVAPATTWAEDRVQRRDRLGGVVHEYVLTA